VSTVLSWNVQGRVRTVDALAARRPIEPLPGPEVPWHERLLVAQVEVEGARVEICNLHSPISSKPDDVKVRTLEAVAQYLAAPNVTPRILVGDLNTPQYEGSTTSSCAGWRGRPATTGTTGATPASATTRRSWARLAG
jgi:endonuclease/exonuclease/phosphatase family metal-dependent hydrolase